MNFTFGIRPVHFTYVISDRRGSSFFFRDVLEMKVLRHIEITSPTNESCPERFSNRWCKTVFGYGPEDSHFGIVLIYFYRDATGFSNEWIGASIRSLSAIARAKAMGFPMTCLDDRTFVVRSPSGRSFSIIDETHRECDPLSEIFLRVTDLKASLYFWNTILCVPVISKTNTEFTLFFGNKSTRLRYILTDSALSDCRGHMSFTATLEILKIIQERCPAEFLVQPVCNIAYEGRAAENLLILQDPSGYRHHFYDSESFAVMCQFDPKAQTRWDLSVHLENKFRPGTKFSQDVLELFKQYGASI